MEPEVVLFFDCPEEEMVKRVLSRNQVVSVVKLIWFGDFLIQAWNLIVHIQHRAELMIT